MVCPLNRNITTVPRPDVANQMDKHDLTEPDPTSISTLQVQICNMQGLLLRENPIKLRARSDWLMHV